MSVVLVNKHRAELLSELLNRVRSEHGFSDLEKLTYAGRLDPLASGLMIILTGDDVHKKPDYLDYDKSYTAEIVFGIQTDTYDILGIPHSCSETKSDPEHIPALLEKIVGTYDQEYPAYSSKTVDGIPLWSLARDGELPDEKPSHTITVYDASLEQIRYSTPDEILQTVHIVCDTVTGDFRQNIIRESWDKTLQKSTTNFIVARIVFTVSSGTYIRTLAHSLGKLTGTGACLLSLHRTRIGDYCL